MKLIKRKGINRFDIINNGENIGYSTYTTFGGMTMMRVFFDKEELKNDIKLRKRIQIATRRAINSDMNEMEVE